MRQLRFSKTEFERTVQHPSMEDSGFNLICLIPEFLVDGLEIGKNMGTRVEKVSSRSPCDNIQFGVLSHLSLGPSPLIHKVKRT